MFSWLSAQFPQEISSQYAKDSRQQGFTLV